MDEVVEAIEKYQGLVPLVYDIETMSLVEARPQDMQYAVYLKREADKVIAHQKYTRCLAMAKIAQDDWHLHNSFYAMGHQEFEKRKCEFYEKWRKRWLELAYKFKEAK